MDFAYAKAATTVPCGDGQNGGQCVTCVVYRPYTPNSTTSKFIIRDDPNHHDFFPLRCHPSTNDNKDYSGDWDTTILQRIRILRGRTRRVLLEDMLSMLGNPPCQQPHGAIIIDDLDTIIRNDPMITTSTNDRFALTRAKMDIGK